jgi:hypothetical protein
MDYANINPEEQRLLLISAKLNLGITWNKLAELLGIHRSMLFFHLRGDSLLPLKSYYALAKAANWHGLPETISLENKEVHPLLPAEMTEDLAEFLGILAGDGHMNKRKFGISVCADKDLDTDYLTSHYPALMQKLFGIRIRHTIQNNLLRAWVHSKKLVSYLEKQGVPTGKKLGKLRIPARVKSTSSFSKAYIRGVFDTDGSFYQHHKTSAAICITSYTKHFLEDIQEALRKEGFSPCISGRNLFLYSKTDIRRFFAEIKPANQKHIQKYQTFVQTGRVPRTKELLAGKR